MCCVTVKLPSFCISSWLLALALAGCHLACSTIPDDSDPSGFRKITRMHSMKEKKKPTKRAKKKHQRTFSFLSSFDHDRTCRNHASYDVCVLFKDRKSSETCRLYERVNCVCLSVLLPWLIKVHNKVLWKHSGRNRIFCITAERCDHSKTSEHPILLRNRDFTVAHRGGSSM